MIRSHTLWTFLIGWMMLFSPALAQKTFYVTADGKPLQDGDVPGITLRDVWKKEVKTLEAALELAQAGDQIWIKGYEMGAKGDMTFYRTQDGFKVKSGVEIYGGFAGDETTPQMRRFDGQLYRLHYRTILTADQDGKDEVDPHNYIYPDPKDNKNQRADNGKHVIMLDMTPENANNNNTLPTTINGCIIARGHAYDAQHPKKEINGGGIYIHGNNTGGGIFRIERCFFTENYGYYGGAIYVSAEVKNTQTAKNVIDRCAFFNNAAGERSRSENFGGAICLVGEGYVLNSTIFNNGNGGVLSTTEGSAVVNCTVTRNTGAGVDAKAVKAGNGKADKKLPVYNCVFWGNAQLTTTLAQLNLQYSAFPETYQLGDPNMHNLQLSERNNEPGVNDKGEVVGAAGPMFFLPSIRTGYDVDFKIREEAYPQWNWEPMEETTLVDQGSNDLYDGIGLSRNPTKDLNGKERKKGKSIDIGAYEFQTLEATRIRYVKPGGKGNGTSWADASGNLQAMIDNLAENNPTNLPGEVWVAKGEYSPASELIPGENYTAAFRMRDGISVFGGFEGKETAKSERKIMEYPWETGSQPDSSKATVLVAKEFDQKNAQLSDNRWNVNSRSRHVVWFAPATYSDSKAPAFTRPTTLDRVTIVGGDAQGVTTDKKGYKSGVGGGIYMNDANAYLRNSVVKYSSARVSGGGVYLKSGRIVGSLVYNCNAGNISDTETGYGNGGGVFVDESGMVLRSMITNNTANVGAGVFLNNEDKIQPNYLVVSTSVISNNTARINGGVYCNKGGVLTQNTITNNYTPTSPDGADNHSPQTGGVYINEYGTVINSVIWNNKINLTGGADNAEATDIPVYAYQPSVALPRWTSTEQVVFLNNAISSVNNAVWTNTLQEGTLLLNDKNQSEKGVVGPDFKVSGSMTSSKDIETKIGAQAGWNWINYNWKPAQGSNLWAAGKPIGQFPEHVLMTPELDMTGLNLFAQKPSIGAFMVQPQEVIVQDTADMLIFYVDADNTDITANGSSWEKAHRSLMEGIRYFEHLPKEKVSDKKMVIRVKAQELWARYAFANEDPKSATLRIPKTVSGAPIYIEGSWHKNEQGVWEQNPLVFRTILNSNPDGKRLEDGNYHCVNIDEDAKVELNGFHIINGYAASTASIQSGAGILAKVGSDVTLRNCVFENNTAKTAAAVDARKADKLTMINCVVNNNTNTSGDSESVIGVPAGDETTHTFDHLTVVNNVGSIPSTITKENNFNSFAAGNTAGNTLELATTGEAGAKNFANPTNKVGSTLGFDTNLGGYSEFRPLTSSVAAGDIINKGTDSNLTKDITMVRDRDLGGIPDLGAFEANLPKKGRVYYVRTSQDGGRDTNDGLSWEKPFATVRYAVLKASEQKTINDEKPQVWVAAGTYQQAPVNMQDPDKKKDPENKNKTWAFSCFEMVDGVNVFGSFPKTGMPGMDDRHPFVSNSIYYDQKKYPDVSQYETILKPTEGVKDNHRVLGQPYIYNPVTKSKATAYVYVGEGKGRYNLIPSQMVSVAEGKGNFYYSDQDAFVKANSEVSTHFYAEQTGFYIDNGGNYVHVKKGEFTYVGEGYGNYLYTPSSYKDVGQGKGAYENRQQKDFVYPTTWDGFTLRDGKLNQAVESSDRNGGAGAVIYKNVTLKNCIVTDCNYEITVEGKNIIQIRGGGVYCDEGTVINCYVQNNTLSNSGTEWGNTCYGAGIYLYRGTMYNCVINENTGTAQAADGAGIFIENGKFFNNTVVGNISNGAKRGNGGICIFKSGDSSVLTIYNCIVIGNKGYTTNMIGHADIAVSNAGTINCYNTITNKVESKKKGNKAINYNKESKAVSNPELLFENILKKNFRLKAGSPALNMGDDVPIVDRDTIYLEYFTDMDFTDRIKDCRVDAGAYESENEKNIKAEGEGKADADTLTYYVTQNGYGTRSGDSPANAACAMKLQRVLTRAGELAKLKAKDNVDVVVKVAGYQDNQFTYHANTLSDVKDPQSYTFVVPYGVTLKGGYNEGEAENGKWKEGTGNWNEDSPNTKPRDITQYKTILSAIKLGTTTQNVNGYHALTFGEKPVGWPDGKDKKTIVDGVYLQDGAATSMAPGNDPRRLGGGAIVPLGGHLRNCVVRNNVAHKGGGVFIEPGGLVTGSLIMDNQATQEGGGIYATNQENLDLNVRAHLLSNTIVKNEAATGGGIFMEDGAVLSANTVVWGNTAGSDQNICGAVNAKFTDEVFSAIQKPEGYDGPTITDWYPFNNCFIQQLEVPGNFNNFMMKSERSRYFKSDDDFTLKPFSMLIDKGITGNIQQTLEKRGVAVYDMKGLKRKNESNLKRAIDVGAFAYTGGVMDTDTLVTRLFVSTSNDVQLDIKDDKEEQKYLGKSFYTSLTSLEDAIDYIEGARKSNVVGKDAREAVFEILMAAGTYKPHRQRDNAAMEEYDQRLNSFMIPYNVKIYGGFNGNELYSSFKKSEKLPVASDTIILLKAINDKNDGLIDSICSKRARNDNNGNNLFEPWEFASQTILSGQLNPFDSKSNAYHVLYSIASEQKKQRNHLQSPKQAEDKEVELGQHVLLDGLTIMKGVTHESVQTDTNDGLAENEVGRGGGIFSKGVNYVLANCRVLENKAVRGGGVFVWDADLYLFNNLFAGNSAEHLEAVNTDSTKYSYGGALVVAATGKSETANAPSAKAKNFNLKAINNLWANNSSKGKGGAIAVYNTQKMKSQHSSAQANEFEIRLANNTFVRNSAGAAPVIFGSYTDSYLVNCLLWGNGGEPVQDNPATANITYSASDVNYHKKFVEDAATNHNILLNKVNHAKDGPHFWRPTTKAGAEGYESTALWNPIAISLATDRGSGVTDNYTTVPNKDKEDADKNRSYLDCWNEFIPADLWKYKGVYNSKKKGEYYRYMGPLDAEEGEFKKHPIDIGFYEYQYQLDFHKMAAIYVKPSDFGLGDGTSWGNATSDLRGAIIGAANPNQEVKSDRTIYVLKGDYSVPSVNRDGTGFPLFTSIPTDDTHKINLTIKGACTGTNHDQNFKDLSVVTPMDKSNTQQLMDISVTSEKKVTIEGFCFTNPNGIKADQDVQRKPGIGVKITKVAPGGKVEFRQSAFRGNTNGLEIGENGLNESEKPDQPNGKLIVVNTLFADNDTGLYIKSSQNNQSVINKSADNATLVNTTFANNIVADMNAEVPATYNSVAWNNKNNKMPETERHNNKVFTVTGDATAAHNANVLEGPNFVDPLNLEKSKRDYRIRPSLHLLDKGKYELYLKHAMGLEYNNIPSIPDSVKDLCHTNRQVGNNIDIGAYEYEALLQPIIYVKEGLTEGKADGTSWKDATGDLQGAVDLAGLYAEVNKDQKAYVFADRNVRLKEQLTISLPNAQIYGGMNGEFLLNAEGQPSKDVEATVKHLLSQRTGMLMQSDHSKLTTLQLNADAVVDGFEVEKAQVNAGTLATSIVGMTSDKDAVVTTVQESKGLLYNSLVYGNVKGVRAVNVTATGTINGAADSGNNRANVQEENRYVTDGHWKYQLNETDGDNLDKGPLPIPQSIIAIVGHDRDLIGNKRVRGTKVDNGCFETWYLNDGGKATTDDYPMGQSVVYVGPDKELLLEKEYTDAAPFNPGFLLLEHHAGLRGNGKAVGLTNFAVERQLGANSNPARIEDKPSTSQYVYDMAVMPFTVRSAEGIKTDSNFDGAKLYTYDAKKRANNSYKFDEVDSLTGIKGAWTSTQYDTDRKPMTTGWLIEGVPGAKVRFYGDSYVEKLEEAVKTVDLKKENHSNPWNGSSATGNKFTHKEDKFTHKENMSWNLFGSPYLCAMKYSDMEYGRVVYGYQKGQYVTIKTYPDNDQQSAPMGYIPAGDAIFTQTATLKGNETFSVKLPTERKDEQPYAVNPNLQVAIARQAATRAGEAVDADVLQLKAVDADKARTDFDLGSDGVKWTNMTAEPQIYAVQNGGHYSLLSAVNREGRVAAGVNLPEKGNFVFFLPKEVDADDYEVVLLHDAKTGRATDLTEETYAFYSEVAGDIEDRFSLSFVRKADDGTATIRVRRLTENTFRVEGTEAGDVIRIFSADGKVQAAATATGFSTTVEAGVPRVAIVEVKRDGRAVGVVKVK